MKVSSGFEDVGFAPVELKITIESKEELQELWHRLDASVSAIAFNASPGCSYRFRETQTLGLWDEVDRIMTARGISP